jgi:hypothetical protein
MTCDELTCYIASWAWVSSRWLNCSASLRVKVMFDGDEKDEEEKEEMFEIIRNYCS